MKIIDVIPITKELFRENLSYFTSKDTKKGDLVMVPLRKKIIPAVVFAAKEIKKEKAFLKKIPVKLKAVKSRKSSFFRPEFIDACKKIADYFISPVGAVLKDFTPQAILESTIPDIMHQNNNNTTYRHEIILMQSPQKERLQYYKSIVREEFARNNSVFLCFPTTAEMEEAAKQMQKGIEKHSIILHNKMSLKKLRDAWIEVISQPHPVLLIATKSFLFLPFSRNDISTIIIENENSSSYKLQHRPYIDVRKAAEILAKEMKIKLIFGDSLIRSETFYKYELQAQIPSSRILSEAKQIIIDISKKQKTDWQKAKSLTVISKELQEILKEAYENHEKVILFLNRRGYGPTTICLDCQRAILCEKCESPLVLHKNKKINFICHKCLAEKEAPEQCPCCKGWRLETFGIGIQRVAEEIKKLFPKFKLFAMDSDEIKNAKQGREIADAFLANPGSILIGTEIIFYYISQLNDQPVERTAVISIDSLFTLPDFRINEKIFHLLLKLRMLPKKTFLIQTSMAERNIFNDAIKGNISGFYKTEIENRQKFQYPPFKLLIKITREGKDKTQIKKEVELLEKKLEKWDSFSYSAFIPKIKNLYSRHILLKIAPETWPDKQPELHQLLSSLSPAWKINVEPESLL